MEFEKIVNEALESYKLDKYYIYDILGEMFIKLALKSKDEELINQIINDKDLELRLLMAKYGSDEMRWKLINDKAWPVRAKVAKYGSIEMTKRLLNDEMQLVKTFAKERLEEESKNK